MTITGDFAGCAPALVEGVERPTSAELRRWLAIESTSQDVQDLLDDAMVVATERILSRCVPFVEPAVDPLVPPVTTELVPSVVGQAILMYAARIFRRRNSASGFEGFADVGFARVGSIDPDIEALLERWLGHDFA